MVMGRFQVHFGQSVRAGGNGGFNQRLAFVQDFDRQNTAGFDFVRIFQRNQFQLLADRAGQYRFINCAVAHLDETLAEHLRLFAIGGTGQLFQGLLFPAVLVFRPESRFVGCADPVGACGQGGFGNVLIVFALIYQINGFL